MVFSCKTYASNLSKNVYTFFEIVNKTVFPVITDVHQNEMHIRSTAYVTHLSCALTSTLIRRPCKTMMHKHLCNYSASGAIRYTYVHKHMQNAGQTVKETERDRA